MALHWCQLVSMLITTSSSVRKTGNWRAAERSSALKCCTCSGSCLRGRERGKGNTAELGEAVIACIYKHTCTYARTRTHTHTPKSLFLYPKHHTYYQPRQNKCVPHPEREKDNGIVPCNDVVCSQGEQQREHQKTAAHHKVAEERTKERVHTVCKL